MKPGTRNCSVDTSEDFLRGLSLFVNTRGLEQSPCSARMPLRWQPIILAYA